MNDAQKKRLAEIKAELEIHFSDVKDSERNSLSPWGLERRLDATTFLMMHTGKAMNAMLECLTSEHDEADTIREVG